MSSPPPPWGKTGARTSLAIGYTLDRPWNNGAIEGPIEVYFPIFDPVLSPPLMREGETHFFPLL